MTEEDFKLFESGDWLSGLADEGIDDAQTGTAPMEDMVTRMIESAHVAGAVSPGNPCSVCRSTPPGVIRTHFHGSELGACPRRVYLSVMDTGTHPAPSNQAFLMDGHTHEMLILKAVERGLAKTGWRIERAQNQAEITARVVAEDTNDMWKIIGHYDGVLTAPDGVKKYILECKAVKENTWREVMNGEISPLWYGQMHMYMYRMMINDAILIVKHRANSTVKALHIPYDHEYVKKRLRGLQSVVQSVNTGSEFREQDWPEREHATKNNKECRYCAYAEKCWR